MKKAQTHISTSGKRVDCSADVRTCPRGGHIRETYPERVDRLEAEKLTSLTLMARRKLVNSSEILTFNQQKTLAETDAAGALIVAGKIENKGTYELAAKNALEGVDDLHDLERDTLLRHISAESTNSATLQKVYDSEVIRNGAYGNPTATLTNLARNPETPAKVIEQLAKHSTAQLTVEAAYAHPNLPDKMYRDALAEANKPSNNRDELHEKAARVAGIAMNARTHPEVLHRLANGSYHKDMHMAVQIGKHPKMGSERNTEEYLNAPHLSKEMLHYRLIGLSNNRDLEPAAADILIKKTQAQGTEQLIYRGIGEHSDNGESISKAVMASKTPAELNAVAQGLLSRKNAPKTTLTEEAANKLAASHPTVLSKQAAFPASFTERNLQHITSESAAVISSKAANTLPDRAWNQLALKARAPKDKIRIATYGNLDNISSTAYAMDADPKVRAAIAKNPRVSSEVLTLITEREETPTIKNAAARELKRREKFLKFAKD